MGNPELYDPTDTCRQTNSRLTADSQATNGRLTADSRTTVLQGVSPNCRGSVGLVSAKCWLMVLLVMLVHVHRDTYSKSNSD